MRSVTIIGAGRAGGAFALALSRAGISVEQIIYRSPASVEAIAAQLPRETRLVPFSNLGEISSNTVLIATADPDIEAVAGQLRDTIEKETIVFHTSGSLSSAVLRPFGEKGVATGSLHPLVSISDPVAGAESFEGAFFCVEGCGRALEAGHEIVESLGGRAFTVAAEQKALYHAAAVTACGHLVALVDAAVEMLVRAGIEKKLADQILLPLIESTVKNLAVQGAARALTGTFARADAAALERHLAAIDKDGTDELREIYLRLGERSLELAAEAGVDAARIDEMRRRISIAKRKPEC